MIPQNEKLEIEYDGKINIATGRNRRETSWKNQEMTWSDFLHKLKETTRTRETFNEYKRLTKEQKGDAKDVGGFVGGWLKGGRRKAGQVAWRSMLTLDADYATPDLAEKIRILYPNAWAIYTTHSHTPESPRLRIIIVLARLVTPEEYNALARLVAAEIGIDYFDDSTYEPERLMFWPSTSSDGVFDFKYNDDPWLDPDEVLAKYPMWQDASTWPESTRTTKARAKHAEKQGDPTEKRGVLGAFCRAYTISAAIEKFLDDVYTPSEIESRYTFTAGTAAAGLVVYDDLFAFSHHGTDPAGGLLCNAFDLVRIHKFGIHDEDAKEDTPINRLPSYKAMTAWAIQDDLVKIEMAHTREQEAANAFSDDLEEETPDDKAWRALLEYNERGGLAKTINNVVLTLKYDPRLAGAIGYDEFNRRQVLRKSVPWRKITRETEWIDSDDSGLRHYLEKAHGITGRDNINDAVEITTRANSFHPIRDYLDRHNWDGVPRIDSALTYFLGVEDTPYTRAISRKWLTAAAARIREPGIKFDYMLILVGAQGVGKSQFFARIAKRTAWFSDSASKFDNSKESMEQLAGKWIIELGELSALKKSEIEHIKTYIAKQNDSYRAAYGRKTENFPRQCVFGGTTNRDDFLQDVTGNRRFWPVAVGDTARLWSEMTPEVVDQIWAEADAAYLLGEDLYLDDEEAAREAIEMQSQYTETGGKVGLAEEYLAKMVPAGWEDRSIKQRIDWLNGFDFGDDGLVPEGDSLRDEISGIELFVEAFNGKAEEYTKANAYEMSDILRQLGWQRTGKTKRLKAFGKQRTFKAPWNKS